MIVLLAILGEESSRRRHDERSPQVKGPEKRAERGILGRQAEQKTRITEQLTALGDGYV